MVLLITSMETSTWLCVEMTGPVQTVGEYVLDPIDGKPKKTSKPNETDSQANIDIEVVNNIDWGNTALNCEGMEGAGSV